MPEMPEPLRQVPGFLGAAGHRQRMYQRHPSRYVTRLLMHQAAKLPADLLNALFLIIRQVDQFIVKLIYHGLSAWKAV